MPDVIIPSAEPIIQLVGDASSKTDRLEKS